MVFSAARCRPKNLPRKNPPDGAIVDYYLPSAAKAVKLEIFDSQRQAGAAI